MLQMDGKFGKRKFIGWPRKGCSKLAYYLLVEIIMFLSVNSFVNLFVFRSIIYFMVYFVVTYVM